MKTGIKISSESETLPLTHHNAGSQSFPDSSDGKESACNAEDLGSVLGLGRCLGEGDGNSLWYSCLENPNGQRSLAGYSPWGCRVGHD